MAETDPEVGRPPVTGRELALCHPSSLPPRRVTEYPLWRGHLFVLHGWAPRPNDGDAPAVGGLRRYRKCARPRARRATDGRGPNLLSAGQQLLDALVRQTEDFRRVPHGQVRVADERPGGRSLGLGCPRRCSLGIGLCRVGLFEGL